MAAEIDAIGLDRGNGAGGVDRGVAGDQHHAGHIAGDELFVVGLRCGGAPLRGDEPVTGDFGGELLQRCGLEAGEDQRSGDWLERGTGGQAAASDGFTREKNLLRLGLLRNLCG